MDGADLAMPPMVAPGVPCTAQMLAAFGKGNIAQSAFGPSLFRTGSQIPTSA